ncbi:MULTISPECIES: hypothetical protein [unclassified Mesorhizobium]|uniref:hypothetical protein n=1 Tax=unclassified Mesorhizobium TaxID=325217 RepID=UPI000F7659A2|nr:MULTISPECIES: hypothetical protein [unclassified Mesorhizobium]AZO06073.1 hypothetical protein EJ068_25620 [Mesorhizobium sp. M2A.F.Ca.ET.043.02.1.1]RUW39615.1 hypothetical protein EOA37_18915 [Mesorhizobium sp. M2A.F.Ca.ET.015.02.1.1]RUW79868.1 hypothetical protein EOA28_06780 [Mesorhizobium sp. M2A.F.Ca.ET.067.02.1.1]RVC95126.1 hypothetical protein EN739_14455 [Mesorhizobium sp. M2A.F.Ca.ET.017.03.2.1]RVD09835.1 hypothetical protein EN753_08630 [Mesorhizobium sp. M2A.F.Ca.ET.029.05.1.1]
MLYLLVGTIPDGKLFHISSGIAPDVNGPDHGNIPRCVTILPLAINLLCWQIKKSPGMPGLFSKIDQPLQRRAPFGAQRTL